MGPANGDTTAGAPARRVGLITMLAGALFVLGGGLGVATDWSWLFVVAAIALLLYAVPKLHRIQTPADGAVGLWGTRLFIFGAVLMVALGVVFFAWEAVGDPGEPAWAEFVWPIGFFAFLLGLVLFIGGSLKARVLDSLGLWLVVAGLVGGVALDMATGAFFEENGESTEWGFLLGVPLAGLGLLWLGYRLRSQQPAATRPA
ncbi:hypothetical protein BH23ACT12_BH23ACT12_02730 [soil metagenome]